MTVIRVGAGPGDPDLVAARALEVLAEASVVVAPRALVGLARALGRAGVPVLAPADFERAQELASGGLVVDLVMGDGLGEEPSGVSGAGARLRPSADANESPGSSRAPDDVVPGPPADVERRVLSALRDPRAVRPLSGLHVVVTRAAAQAGELSRPLRRRGARVIEVPTIRIDPPADGGLALEAALARIESYDWLVVTSVNGARAVLDRLPDGRRLAGVRLAAIGPATAATLAAAHLPPDLVPTRFVAESLLEEFPPGPGRVLVARAAVARDALPVGLAGRGWDVAVVEAYRTATPELPTDLLDEVVKADVACFTAPSTFERFCSVAGLERLPSHLACIGPVTAAAVRRAGREPTVEASVHTMTGLVEALVEWAASRAAAAGAAAHRHTGEGGDRPP